MGRTAFLLRQLLRHCMWVDRILYPAALAVLLLSLIWLRQLWRNPLFTASWIAFAGNAVYILRRQDDYAPRYFLAMLVPLILVLVLALQELKIRNRGLASLLAATLALAVVLDTAQVFGFLSSSPIPVLQRSTIHPGNRECGPCTHTACCLVRVATSCRS